MGDVMKEAAFSLAEAKFASGADFNQQIVQNVSKAQIKVYLDSTFQQGQYFVLVLSLSYSFL